MSASTYAYLVGHSSIMALHCAGSGVSGVCCVSACRSRVLNALCHANSNVGGTRELERHGYQVRSTALARLLQCAVLDTSTLFALLRFVRLVTFKP